MESKPLWEILVPTVSNEGKPYRTRFHRVWDKKVRDIAGGLTILKPAVGHWVSEENELFKERMIPVRIMCSEEEIMEIAEMTKKYYDQLAIFIVLISEKAIVYS